MTRRAEIKPRGLLALNEQKLLRHIDAVLLVQEAKMIAKAQGKSS